MARPEKVSAVADIKARLEGSHAVFLAEYAGLSVKEQQALRRELLANDAEFKVIKMTLARRAADELELEELEGLLVGPTGLAYAEGDPAAVAKVLRDFAKDHGVFTIKGGLLGREFLTPERISQLADIPPRDVLLAMVAGVLQAPLTSAASVLAALPRSAATILQQLLERRDDESDVPGPADDAEPGDDDSSAAAVADDPVADDAAAPADDTEPVTEDPVTEDPVADDEATRDPADEAGSVAENTADEEDDTETADVVETSADEQADDAADAADEEE